MSLVISKRTDSEAVLPCAILLQVGEGNRRCRHRSVDGEPASNLLAYLLLCAAEVPFQLIRLNARFRVPLRRDTIK